MLSLFPQKLDDFHWYYEENGGIYLYHSIKGATGQIIDVDCVIIPWRKLSASLKRKQSTKPKRQAHRKP